MGIVSKHKSLPNGQLVAPFPPSQVGSCLSIRNIKDKLQLTAKNVETLGNVLLPPLPLPLPMRR